MWIGINLEGYSYRFSERLSELLKEHREAIKKYVHERAPHLPQKSFIAYL